MSQTKAQLIDPVDGTIVNADINASAAIAGSKISPDFGSQNIVTTGSVGIGIGSQTPSTPQKQLHIAHDSSPRIMLSNDTTGHATPNGTELLLDSSGNFEIFQRENLNVEFFTNGSQRMTINGSGNVGIGTATASQLLHLKSGAPAIQFEDTGANGSAISVIEDNDGLMKLRNDPGNAGTGSGITFEVDASEIMRIDSSGRLLLGTTTEGVANASKFTIATSAHCGVTIRSGAAHDGQIAFSDGTSGDDEFRGQIRYNHTSNFLAIATDATERLRIDSSGNVGIGTTSPQRLLHQHVSTSSSNYHSFTNSTTGSGAANGLLIGLTQDEHGIVWNYSNEPLRFATNNSERMRIQPDGKIGMGTTAPNTNLHVLGSNSGGDLEALRLHNNNTATGTRTTLAFTNTTDATVEHAKITATRDNSGRLDFFVGAQSHAVLCVDGFASGVVGVNTVQASKALDVNGEIRTNTGILFGSDTAAANRLEDYEEGTFSPAFKAENNSSSATTNVSEAKYTKIGDVVTVIFYITLGAHASGTQGGTARISGLPFTNGSRHSAISVGYYQHFNANQTWFGGTVQPSISQILLRHLIGGSAGDGSNNMDYDNNLKVGSQIIITATYTTN